MSDDIASLVIEVDSKGIVHATKVLDKLEKEALQAEKASKKLGKGFDSVKKASNSLYQSITSLKAGFAGLAIGASINSIVSVGSAVEDTTVRMRFLTGSVEEGAEAMEALINYASQVPFSLEEIQQGATALLVVSKGTEELNELLKITGDLATVSGLSFSEASGQMQRALSGGIASADLFRERGVKAFLGFEEGVQYSAEQTKNHILNAFREGTTSAIGATSEMAETFTGKVSMMGDALFTLKNTLATTGTGDFAKEMVEGFTDAFQMARRLYLGFVDIDDIKNKSDKSIKLELIQEQVNKATIALADYTKENKDAIDSVASLGDGFQDAGLASHELALKTLIDTYNNLESEINAVRDAKAKAFGTGGETLNQSTAGDSQSIQGDADFSSVVADFDEAITLQEELDQKLAEQQAVKFNESLLRLEESLLTEEERLRLSYENRQAIVDEAHENGLISDQKFFKMSEDLENEHRKKSQEKITSLENFSKGSDKDKQEFASRTAKKGLSDLAKSSKNAFELNKNVDAIQSLNNTRVGVTKALAQGGIQGYLMAGGILASGLQQVRDIQASSFGGGSGGVTTPTSPTANLPVAQDGITQPTETEPQTIVNVDLSQDGLTQEGFMRFVDFINEDAPARGVFINANVVR